MSTYNMNTGINILTLTPRNFDTCLYHNGCPDGIASAYPFWRENRDRYAPLNYKDALSSDDKLYIQGVKHNEPYPFYLIKNRRVVIVDFSYDPMTIINICKIAKSVCIIDHHETFLATIEKLGNDIPSNFGYILDLSRSGAQIVWQWAYPDLKVPWFIDIIADRDLWRWSIPGSEQIGKALYHMNLYNWENMEGLYHSTESEEDLKRRFYDQGKMIMDFEKKDIDYAVATNKLCEFEGFRVRITNCNPIFRSEVGNELANLSDCDFGAVWRYDFETDQWWINLRGSKKNKIFLNKICEKYGGGGHAKACGFTIHGPNSSQYRNADSKSRAKMAHGNIHDYFIMIKN